MEKHFYIYILTNKSGTLYIGITNNLVRRVWEHKESIVKKKKTYLHPSEFNFTTKYNVNELVYYEVFDDPENAILREKQLKRWNRKKKLNLIQKMNPSFKDLYQQIL